MPVNQFIPTQAPTLGQTPAGAGLGAYAQAIQNAFLNPLMKQQLAQQIAQSKIKGAEAQFAPEFFGGTAAQQKGLGLTNLAQGAFAPQYFGGQAAIQTGLGQQQEAIGQQTLPQQIAQTQTMQASAQQAPAQQLATTAELQQNVLTQRLTNQYLPLVQKAAAAGQVIPALNNVLHNLKAIGASPEMIQTVINQLTAAAKAVHPNAPNTPINPQGWGNVLLGNKATKNSDGTISTSSGRKFIRDPSSPTGWKLAQ